MAKTYRSVFLFSLIFFFTCSSPSKKEVLIAPVFTVEEFSLALHTAGKKMVIFLLYSELCIPCKILSPVILEIADENAERVKFYEIDADSLPHLADYFGATEVPFVVFYRNRHLLYAVSGIQSKDEYLRIITTLSDSADYNQQLQEQKKVPEALRVSGTTFNNN